MNKKIIFSNIEPRSNCFEDCTDEEGLWCDCNNIVFSDEMANLNQKIDGRILAIADLGLWNGRRMGYKILTRNINSIFSINGYDSFELFGDGRNIRGIYHHHDGTNYIEFRVIKEDKNIDNLLNKLYNQQVVSRAMINTYTKSLYPYVAKIYGW